MKGERILAEIRQFVESGMDLAEWKKRMEEYRQRPKPERLFRRPRKPSSRPPVPYHIRHPQMTLAQRRAYKKAAQRASQIVCRAVKAGKLVNLKTEYTLCADCKENRAVSYDHRDYSKPLEVTPVCGSCNLRRGQAYFSTGGAKISKDFA